ncbi:MAG: acyl carrier protein [Chloroflexi bacterium]|nr:acyl carrier protein [Chloroflexota bacterium]MBU1746216.1 acyl carrier protein [Chloroflexota bacterium]
MRTVAASATDKRDLIFQRVRAIVAEVLGIDEERITLDAHFREDLRADSLDLVELIMRMEEEFEGDIYDPEAQQITTVGEVVTYIETLMLHQT